MQQSEYVAEFPEPVAVRDQPVSARLPVRRIGTTTAALFEIEHDDDDAESFDQELELQEPSREHLLSAYETMMLYYYLNVQLYESGQSPRLPTGQPRPIYDWFVNSLNVAPLCDWLFSYLQKLSAWQRKSSGKPMERGKLHFAGSEIPRFTDWERLPGLKA